MATISVVIPTYNRAPLLGRAIESVLRQSFEDFEILVVDDGSTDETPGMVASYSDPRLRYLRQPNRGRTAARNVGARRAAGLYLTFLDSDDEALPGWLAGLVEQLSQPDTAVACCGVRTIVHRPHLSIDGKVSERLPRNLGPLYGGYTALFLAGTFGLRREVFEAVGGYDERLRYAENTELAHRLVAYLRDHAWTIRSVDRPLVVYHHHRGASTRDGCRDRLEAVERILERHGAHYFQHSRRAYSSWCAVAGVNATRLGLLPRARRHLLAAIRAYPRYPAHYARFALTFVPASVRARLGSSPLQEKA